MKGLSVTEMLQRGLVFAHPHQVVKNGAVKKIISLPKMVSNSSKLILKLYFYNKWNMHTSMTEPQTQIRYTKRLIRVSRGVLYKLITAICWNYLYMPYVFCWMFFVTTLKINGI